MMVTEQVDFYTTFFLFFLMCVPVTLFVSFQVIDTAGLSDPHVPAEQIYREVGKSLAIASPGPHIMLLALRCDRRFTDVRHALFVIINDILYWIVIWPFLL
jgi:hypothetical protein